MHAGQVGARPDARTASPTPSRSLRRRARALLGACATADAGERLVAIGDRELTVNMAAAAGAIEIAVHGWDISAACGARQPVPPGLAAALLPLAPLLIPRATRAGLFADPVPCPRRPAPATSSSPSSAAGRGLHGSARPQPLQLPAAIPGVPAGLHQ